MKNLNLKLVVAVLVGLLLPLFIATSVFAASPNCKTSGGISVDPATGKTVSKTATPAEAQACLKKNPIISDINTIVAALSAGVGIVVIIVIILGGVQYTMAGDNAQAISAAKQRIINGLIALVAFMLAFAFLQWIIPGGL